MAKAVKLSFGDLTTNLINAKLNCESVFRVYFFVVERNIWTKLLGRTSAEVAALAASCSDGAAASGGGRNAYFEQDLLGD